MALQGCWTEIEGTVGRKLPVIKVIIKWHLAHIDNIYCKDRPSYSNRRHMLMAVSNLQRNTVHANWMQGNSMVKAFPYLLWLCASAVREEAEIWKMSRSFSARLHTFTGMTASAHAHSRWTVQVICQCGEVELSGTFLVMQCHPKGSHNDMNLFCMPHAVV